MIYGYPFKFGTGELRAKTLRAISSEILEDIELLLQDSLDELNHNIRNSSAYKFNEGQLHVPIFVSKEFIDFLELNIIYFRQFGDAFNPFSVNEPLTDWLEFDDTLIVDRKQKSIIKLKEVVFDSSFFRNAFIIDLLSSLLLEKGIHDFLLETSSITLCKGNFIWEVEFTNTRYTKGLRFQSFTSAGIAVEKEDYDLLRILDANESTILWSALVIFGESANYVRMISLLIEELQSEADFKEFCTSWNVEIVCINDQNEILKEFR